MRCECHSCSFSQRRGLTDIPLSEYDTEKRFFAMGEQWFQSKFVWIPYGRQSQIRRASATQHHSFSFSAKACWVCCAFLGWPCAVDWTYRTFKSSFELTAVCITYAKTQAIFRHLVRSFVDFVQHDCGHNCNICNMNSETNCFIHEIGYLEIKQSDCH